MASRRNEILDEIEGRLRLVTGVAIVLESPVTPPQHQDYPAISVFPGSDEVIDGSMTGDYPTLKRKWPFSIIPYMVGSDADDDEAAKREINDFLDLIRKELYRGGTTLSGRCAVILERSVGDYLKPYRGKPGIGLEMFWEITYYEEIQSLYS